MARKSLYQGFYEIEKKHSQRLEKQNSILAFGSIIVFWILMLLQENFFIAFLPVLPIIYVMIRDLFFNKEAME